MAYVATGTAGNDVLNQSSDTGPGTIVGLAGDDSIVSGTGPATVTGNSGNDTVIAAGRQYRHGERRHARTTASSGYARLDAVVRQRRRRYCLARRQQRADRRRRQRLERRRRLHLRRHRRRPHVRQRRQRHDQSERWSGADTVDRRLRQRLRLQTGGANAATIWSSATRATTRWHRIARQRHDLAAVSATTVSRSSPLAAARSFGNEGNDTVDAIVGATGATWSAATTRPTAATRCSGSTVPSGLFGNGGADTVDGRDRRQHGDRRPGRRLDPDRHRPT